MEIKHKEYLRSVLFGIEDSLVSTTGLIAGISVGSDNNRFVLLAGIVAVTIEAVSMGVGEYLSDDALNEFDKLKRDKDNPWLSGLLMSSSYFLAGIIPLLPVVFFTFPFSLGASIILALFSLFTLGYLKGKLLNTPPFKGAVKILIGGGIAALLGLLVGFVFRL